jgi:hypothetical protein
MIVAPHQARLTPTGTMWSALAITVVAAIAITGVKLRAVRAWERLPV